MSFMTTSSDGPEEAGGDGRGPEAFGAAGGDGGLAGGRAVDEAIDVRVALEAAGEAFRACAYYLSASIAGEHNMRPPTKDEREVMAILRARSGAGDVEIATAMSRIADDLLDHLHLQLALRRKHMLSGEQGREEGAG